MNTSFSITDEHRLKAGARGKRMFFASVLLMLLAPVTLLHAATLSIDPESGTYGPGDIFVATVRLDTAPDECVNAVQVNLAYPTDWMKAVAVSKGESLMTLWPDEPVIDTEHGTVSFTGGIPAGYCGRVLGDPGKTNIVAKVAFTVPGMMIGGKTASGPVPADVVFASGTQVLLNDGFGTQAPLTLKNGKFVRALSSPGIKNEWTDIVHGDDIPPDTFTVSVEHDPNAFSGKYFIVFSTVDKQSGVDHYEVSEDDPERLGFVRGTNDHALFYTATSPYVLRDQELKSRIVVRAFDEAGNKQERIVAPIKGAPLSDANTPSGTSLDGTSVLIGIIVLLALVAIGGTYLYLKHRNATKEKGTTDMTGIDEGVL